MNLHSLNHYKKLKLFVKLERDEDFKCDNSPKGMIHYIISSHAYPFPNLFVQHEFNFD